MIKEADLNNIAQGRKGRPSSGATKDILAFINSNMNCAEVVITDVQKYHNISTSYYIVNNRMGKPICVVSRNKHLYLVKKEFEQKINGELNNA